jgi:hypothetical protein
MDRLQLLIEENLSEFPAFDYYLPIIEKAKRFENSRPDTSIECCNALMQGISKTVILGLDDSTTIAELDTKFESKSDKLVKRALLCLKQNDDVYEEDFCRRGASLADAISLLRNARGDISHGRAVPKRLSSHHGLAKASNEMTGSLLSYMLSSYFIAKIEASKKVEPEEPKPDFDLEYKDNPDFNDYLDEENPLPGKMLYSEALFLSYVAEYQIELDEFRGNMEDSE